MFHLSEFMFLGGFIVFIAAILVLDMLVIDKKAHEVSIREAGTWTAVWITLALVFSVFLWFKGDMVHGISSFADLKAVASAYAPHLQLDPSDFEASLQQYRHYMTVSYISGYLIEKTLSVDNLFVMMMIFTAFGVGKNEYQHVLNWGILGAIVLRFVFIFLGAAIISRFDWVLLVFGGQYVHLDATFDNSLGRDGVIRYDYFNLDDKRLFRDHQPVICPVPACAAIDRFYYREAKLSFTKVEDVVKRAQMSIRKDLPFVFHWRGGPFTREVLAELVKALEEAAQKRGRHAAVSFNRSQAVLQVHFPTELPGEAAEEDANEGEQYEGE